VDAGNPPINTLARDLVLGGFNTTPRCDVGTPIDVDGHPVPYWTAGCAYTTPFNLTGQPVVVIPMTQSAEGLPIGLQIVGRRWGKIELLRIAEQLEALIGPCRQPPGY
jgi:amidase